MFSQILDDPIGRIIVSILLGLGLASIFRKVCTGKSCVIIHGPNPKDVSDYYYKVDEDCFKYTPYTTECKGEHSEGKANEGKAK
jgi:hypothetical protein